MKAFKEKIHTILFFAKFLIYGIVVALPRLKREMRAKEGERIMNRDGAVGEIAYKWSEYCLNAAGVKITVKGTEKIPKDKPVLFVPNHQGYADIPVLLYALRGYPFGFVIRYTMAALPIIRSFVAPLGCVSIKQEDIRQSVSALNKASENINDGFSMLIFPEGRREFTNTPKPFKNGAFKIVQKTGVTVVPIYLHNSHMIFEANGKKIGSPDVTVTILNPIETAEMSRADIKVLNEKVFDAINSAAKDFNYLDT